MGVRFLVTVRHLRRLAVTGCWLVGAMFTLLSYFIPVPSSMSFEQGSVVVVVYKPLIMITTRYNTILVYIQSRV